MNFIFTDIDGVLNPKFKKVWDKKCINVYNKICSDFDLSPIITSTWRIRYSLPQLQDIFINQGINVKIFDFTPIINDQRGLEVKEWLSLNEYDNYVVIDDKIKNITPFVKNVVKCNGYIGLTEEHYDIIKNILKIN